MIEFDGKEYPTKLLDIPDFGEKLVSIESLQKSLHDAEGFYVSDEARVVDEKIFFFVPDNAIDEDEKALTEFVDECLHDKKLLN